MDLEWWDEGNVSPSPAVFNYVFDECNFSIIENVRTKCIIFGKVGVAYSELGSKNMNKICLKNVQEVLKQPLQYVIFQKFSG